MLFTARSIVNPLFIIHVIEFSLGVALVVLVSGQAKKIEGGASGIELVHAAVYGLFSVTSVLLLSYVTDGPIDEITMLVVAPGAIILYTACAAVLGISMAKEAHARIIASFILALLLILAFVADFILHVINVRHKLLAVRHVLPPRFTLGPHPMVGTVRQAVGMDPPASRWGVTPPPGLPPSRRRRRRRRHHQQPQRNKVARDDGVPRSDGSGQVAGGGNHGATLEVGSTISTAPPLQFQPSVSLSKSSSNPTSIPSLPQPTEPKPNPRPTVVSKPYSYSVSRPRTATIPQSQRASVPPLAQSQRSLSKRSLYPASRSISGSQSRPTDGKGSTVIRPRPSSYSSIRPTSQSFKRSSVGSRVRYSYT